MIKTNHIYEDQHFDWFRPNNKQDTSSAPAKHNLMTYIQIVFVCFFGKLICLTLLVRVMSLNHRHMLTNSKNLNHLITNPIKFNSSPPFLRRQRHKYYENVYSRGWMLHFDHELTLKYIVTSNDWQAVCAIYQRVYPWRDIFKHLMLTILQILWNC